MYGTVALLRAKPGMEQQLSQHLHDFEAAHVPGALAVYCYRTDEDAQNYYLAVVFESREAYQHNAESPDQDRRYHQMLSLLEKEPVWHDGEIVASYDQSRDQSRTSAMNTQSIQSGRSS
ncbi:MAG: hypothetical protein NVS2B12_24050 [Ktedonobacteraceae bacterium]